MIVGFTGTQRGMTAAQRETLADMLENTPDIEHALHGDCVGADAEFHDLVRTHAAQAKITTLPSDVYHKRAYCEADHVMRPAPPLVRNAAIVAIVQLLYACPKGTKEERRSGTWATVRYAMRAAVPVVVIWPNGDAAMVVSPEALDRLVYEPIRRAAEQN